MLFQSISVHDGFVVDAAVNEDCVLQTHLFEDRVLKASRLRIGAGCSLGTTSVVLYESVIEDGSRLDALSLLMKGERLPAGTMWAGNPAAPQLESKPSAPRQRADDECWTVSAS